MFTLWSTKILSTRRICSIHRGIITDMTYFFVSSRYKHIVLWLTFDLTTGMHTALEILFHVNYNKMIYDFFFAFWWLDYREGHQTRQRLGHATITKATRLNDVNATSGHLHSAHA